MQAKNINTTPLNNPLIRFISEKKYRWLRHTLFIAIGFLLAFKGDLGAGNDPNLARFREALLIVDSITFVFIMAMVYLLFQVLIPKLLFGSRIFLFFLSFVIIV